MEIVSPVWPADDSAQLAQSTLKSLEGVRIALVDDNLDPEFTDELEKQLVEAHGAKVTKFVKPLGTAPSPKELIAEAARAQVAVVGIAL